LPRAKALFSGKQPKTAPGPFPGRGGLRTPVKAARAQPRRVPAKSAAGAYFSVIMPYPGLHPARIRGRAERVPPRKPPSPSSPAFPRKASPPGLASPRRGGLRTPVNETLVASEDRPIGPPGFRLPPMVMSCLGMSTALPRGRGDRAPPRKPPPNVISGLSPQGL
jgi:hypothetical protein